MMIFFLINSPYPRYAGGIENWLYNVSERLSDKHEITIISQENDELPLLYSDISNRIKTVKFKTLRSSKLIRPFIRSYLVLFDIFLGSIMMGLKLKKEIRHDARCYVIALDSMFCVKAGLIAKKNRDNIRLISSVRGPHAEIYGKSFRCFRNKLLRFEKKMLSAVDLIWANGYDTIDLLSQKGFTSILMKNGVDYNGLTASNAINHQHLITDGITVGSVGTLLPIKGIYELISAASILKYKYKQKISLIFVGKGEPKDFIKHAIEKGIDKDVYFLGHKEKPIEYIKGCTICACLSGGSGMSMAAIECMTSGVPIIAWDSPVYRQFNRNGETMLLVKKKDVNELANGLLEIVKNYEKYRSRARLAIKEAVKYDWSIVCNDIINSLRNDI